MNLDALPIERLLDMVKAKSPEALEELFRRHREPLSKMVAACLDARLKSRIDVSDIVQETLIEANRRIEAYAEAQPIAFYPWLRQIAVNRMIDAYRHHVQAKRRSTGRQVSNLPGDFQSGLNLMDKQADSATSPSGAAQRKELREDLRAAIDSLEAMDRNVIQLRHIKRLSTRETAEALGVSEAAVKIRLLRALQRLRAHLGGHESE